MNKTDTGKDRLGRAKDRLDVKIAEMVEEMADGPGHPKDVSQEENPNNLNGHSSSLPFEQQAQGENPNNLNGRSNSLLEEAMLERSYRLAVQT